MISSDPNCWEEVPITDTETAYAHDLAIEAEGVCWFCGGDETLADG